VDVGEDCPLFIEAEPLDGGSAKKGQVNKVRRAGMIDALSAGIWNRHDR